MTDKIRLFMICGLLLIMQVIGISAQDDTILTVVSWNLESGDIDPDTITSQIRQFEDVHIWGLSEVFSSDAMLYEVGLENKTGLEWQSIVGTTGFGDRLVILYDASRLNLVGSTELMDISLGESVRAPLVAQFEDNITGEMFLFGVNHLARGNEFGRHTQATQLNDWAEQQTLPIILVGDFNFDYEVDDSYHDAGFDNLIEDGVFSWVRPDELIRTQCSADDDAADDGIPEDQACRYNSVLDFIFVAGDAQTWLAESEVVVRNGDFPDDVTTSDHRPVMASFLFVSESAEVTKAELLERIEALEAEVAELRELVEQLP